MPLKSTSFIPNLIKQMSEKYSKKPAQDIQRESRDYFIDKDLLIELNTIFGQVLERALRLLDDQQIIVFRLESNLREIVQITEGRNSSNVCKLYPNVNFCTCDYFKRQILNLSGTDVLSQTGRYTCEHVLAIHLIKILELPVIREEILPKHKFNNFLSGMNGSFQINEDGFRVTVENGKCMQANLYITTSCFSEYHVDGIVNFSLNMNVISECLAIFTGIDCSMKMFYKGQGAPLIIVLEPHDEDDITTECSIKTTHHEEPIDFNLDENSSSLNVVFIRGPDLATIFHELDKSAEELEITLSPRKPHFKIDTLGVMQSESSIEVAKTSDMMMLFNCRETTKSRYKSSQIRLTLKALSAASKVAMKTDSSGLLEMHFMIQSDEQAEVYIQFFITPLAEIEF